MEGIQNSAFFSLEVIVENIDSFLSELHDNQEGLNFNCLLIRKSKMNYSLKMKPFDQSVQAQKQNCPGEHSPVFLAEDNPVVCRIQWISRFQMHKHAS